MHRDVKPGNCQNGENQEEYKIIYCAAFGSAMTYREVVSGNHVP